MELTKAYQELYAHRAALKAHIETAEAEKKRLCAEVEKASLAIQMSEAGIDQDLIAAAKAVITVYGDFSRAGEDRHSVRADAIRQIVTGQPIRETYGDLWRVAFGTKNYDRWSGQRCDCEYGYGPSHGSICFSIGLHPEVRKREEKTLTADEMEAVIYYLTNLERVQEAERTAKAA